MSRAFVVSGTDTGIGKTVFAAALAGALNARYWKPIQAGLEGGGDRETVRRLSGLDDAKILPETYRLTSPLSPHRAAAIDGVEIDLEKLRVPEVDGPLVIEGAGGLMVPLTRKLLQIRLYMTWELPVILVARTALGTINHSLLSIHALRMHELPVHGIAFVGEQNSDSERTICEMGDIKHLGRLPVLDPLNAESLRAAFAANFKLEDFA